MIPRRKNALIALETSNNPRIELEARQPSEERSSWRHEAVGAVHPHMPVQVSALGEAQQAELALVRLLSAVDAQVLGERAAVRKGLLAQPTPVRPFAGVRAHMRCH